LTLANNRDIARAFSQRNRKELLRLSDGIWKELSTRGLEQFEFSMPTPRGMVSFLRVQNPEEYGELNSSFRPMVVKCDEERKLIRGLEQGRSGYAFRAITPIFFEDKYVGCVELGTRINQGFLKRLNGIHKGAWSIVNLDRGVEIHGGDKAIIGTLNEESETATVDSETISDEALKEIRAGRHYREANSKTESVSIYLPVRNFKGDVALYFKHSFKTNYYKKIRKSILTSAGICLLGLLLSGLVVYALYRQITGPIDELVAETEKIKRFDLDAPVTINARLKEIQKLVNAIATMKTSLSSFKKYVPAQLVRQLIETNQEAKISGQRRELTMLFSDIADFTTISESLRPSELTAQLSEYLNAATEVIMAEHGTVDKYIGDAVMAFWGAPLAMADHAAAACRAALRVQKKINALNKRWVEEGRPVFITRIGINTGEAIVGNMGSEQRLNYTVIGDSVNLASRLEGTNKNYKTRIIISESTYEACKETIEARVLDFTTVKGKSEIITIYELIAEKGDISSIDKEFARQFTEAVLLYRDRKWNEALERFSQLARKRPDDQPTKIFLERCQEFKNAAA
jgi:class 3 adenylate cyclase